MIRNDLKKIPVIVLATLSLFACKPENTQSSDITETVDQRPTGLAGGTALDPVQVQTNTYYEISESSSQNYFEIAVSAGDVIHLNAVYDEPLGRDWANTCASSRYSTTPKGIVFNSVAIENFCYRAAIYEAENNETVSMNIDAGTTGYFRIDIVQADAIPSYSGGNGLPSSPIRLSSGQQYGFEEDFHENYFQWIARKGEVIYLSLENEKSENTNWGNQCAGGVEVDGTATYYYAPYIEINGQGNCDDVAYTAPENSILNIRVGTISGTPDYIQENSGQLEVFVSSTSETLFQDVTDAEVDSQITSGPLYIQSNTDTVTIDDGSLIINDTEIAELTANVNYGDKVSVKVTSANSYETAKTVTISTNDEQGFWTVTTASMP